MKLITYLVILSGFVFTGHLQADPKPFSPKVERVSNSEILVSLGRDLLPSAKIEIGPVLNPVGQNLRIKEIKHIDSDDDGIIRGLTIHLMPNHEMDEKLDYALFIKEKT